MTTGTDTPAPPPDPTVSVYDTVVDPDDPNNAHAAALDLVGWNKDVLEVGCAGGHVTKALADRNCTVVGVEVDAGAAVAARRHAGRVVVGDLDGGDVWAGLAGEAFDTLLFGDVLEHLRDPGTALRRSLDHLRPGGTVVISVPNVAHGDIRLALLAGTFPYRDWGLLDRTHLRFFTRSSLLELVRQAGLVPLELRRVVVPLFGTELAVSRDGVDPVLVDRILQDPESETYQFVVLATRDDGNAALRRSLARLARLEELQRSEGVRLALARAESAREAEEPLQEELGRLRLERDRLRAEIADLRTRAEADGPEARAGTESATWDREELERLQATRTFRWLRPFRAVYGRVLARRARSRR